MRIAAAFLLAVAWMPPAGAQTSFTPVDQYGSFFMQVSRLPNEPAPILLNGQVSQLRQASLQEAIGLSDLEAATVRKAARALASTLAALDRTPGNVTFDARMAALSLDTPDPIVLARYAALMKSRERMIREQIESLRASLGDARFQVVDRFVGSMTEERPLLPLSRR